MKFDTLTLALLASTALLTALAASLTMGAGQSVDWLPAGPAREVAPAQALQPVLPLPPQALALTWQQSMFSPDRKPDLATGKAQASSLDGISLSGVIIDGQAQWVLLRMPDKRHLKLAVGSSLDNGWTLTGATPQQATFTHQARPANCACPGCAFHRLLKLPSLPFQTYPHHDQSLP